MLIVTAGLLCVEVDGVEMDCVVVLVVLFEIVAAETRVVAGVFVVVRAAVSAGLAVVALVWLMTLDVVVVIAAVVRCVVVPRSEFVLVILSRVVATDSLVSLVCASKVVSFTCVVVASFMAKVKA